MKIKMDQIIGCFDSSEALLEKDAPVEFTFKLANLMMELKPKREAFAMAIRKIEKDDKGIPNEAELITLLNQEVDVKIPNIKKSELMSAYEKLPVKTVMALYPFIEDDTVEAVNE